MHCIGKKCSFLHCTWKPDILYCLCNAPLARLSLNSLCKQRYSVPGPWRNWLALRSVNMGMFKISQTLQSNGVKQSIANITFKNLKGNAFLKWKKNIVSLWWATLRCNIFQGNIKMWKHNWKHSSLLDFVHYCFPFFIVNRCSSLEVLFHEMTSVPRWDDSHDQINLTLACADSTVIVQYGASVEGCLKGSNS